MPAEARTRTRAPELARDSGKDAEIQFLEWCREQVAGKDLYLSSFFSENVVGEIIYRIKGDLDTDLYPYYQASLEAGQKTEQAVSAARSEYVAALQARDEEIAELKAESARLAAAQTELRSRIVEVTEHCSKQHSEICSLLDKINKLKLLAKNAWFGNESINPEDLRCILSE